MTEPKQVIPNLMIFAGAMVILCAIPEGIIFAFQSRQVLQADWLRQMISGAVMMAGCGVTGSLLILTGGFLLKPRQNSKDKMIPRDVA